MSSTAASQFTHTPLDAGLQADLIDNIEAGIVVLGEDFTVLEWNLWMTQHTGLCKEDVLAQRFQDIFPNLTNQRIYQCIETCLNFGNSAILSTALNPFPLPLFEPKQLAQSSDSQPTRIHQSITIKPLRDSQGQRHCILQILDVSAAFRRERLLREQSNKANAARIEAEKASNIKSEFTSMVSHELRTPLTAIQGALKLVASGVIADIPESLSSLLDIAFRNTDRLLLLINDLLDVHKIEAGKLQYDYQHVNILELLMHTIEANQPYAEKYDISFTLSLHAQSAMAQVDKNRIQQVVTNLLSNAAKFSKPGSDVAVNCQIQGSELVVSVTDTGDGIPKEFQSRIFERYAQADASNTRPTGGTGLGLCISREIITQHQGKIWFETEAGQGTTFYFTLPITPDTTA